MLREVVLLFVILYLLPVTVIRNGRNMLQYRNIANNKKIIAMLCLAQTISYEVRLAFILLSFVVLVCRYNLA
jgi:hypothetical protein